MAHIMFLLEALARDFWVVKGWGPVFILHTHKMRSERVGHLFKITLIQVSWSLGQD